jgi:riboflavin synthase
MFTGIIEETGKVRSVQPDGKGAQLVVAAAKVPPALKPGDSVAVNGVCLTVTRNAPDSFAADLSAETLRLTTLGAVRTGAVVNLERPLALGDRLGGHMVQGHVDATGRVASITPSGDGVVMAFEYPPGIERYLVYKGSIAIDGISLTIASLEPKRFTVAVIPLTLRATTLGRAAPGDAVNLETDIIGKYFERYFQLGVRAGGPGLTADYLKQQGY